MRQRGKLLRLRPFNMANFSSGAGLISFFGFFFAVFCIFPSVVIIWAGLARPLMNENGVIDYNVLVRRLKKILLPICILAFVVLTLFLLMFLDGIAFVFYCPFWLRFSLPLVCILSSDLRHLNLTGMNHAALHLGSFCGG